MFYALYSVNILLNYTLIILIALAITSGQTWSGVQETATRKVAHTCDPSCASRLTPTKAPFKEDGSLDLLVSPLSTLNGHEDETRKRFRTLQLEIL